MAMISLVEDFNLVGFETLAVEVQSFFPPFFITASDTLVHKQNKDSMLNLTRAIDRATGYVFVPPADSKPPPEAVNNMDAVPPDLRPNAYGLFSTSIGQMKGPLSDIRDVQERWIDEREAYDAYENREWRKEGETVRDELARSGKIRQRHQPTGTEEVM